MFLPTKQQNNPMGEMNKLGIKSVTVFHIMRSINVCVTIASVMSYMYLGMEKHVRLVTTGKKGRTTDYFH